MAKFSEIPKLTSEHCYTANYSWNSLISNLAELQAEGLDINPEFQRSHVWTEAQKIAYVEFRLKGGIGANEIRFNCVGWNEGKREHFVLVDGKQRLQAVLDFLNDKIPVFGAFFSNFTDQHFIRRFDFLFKINDLKEHSDVLQWYLDINTTGTPHTPTEINKVQTMLLTELMNKNGQTTLHTTTKLK